MKLLPELSFEIIILLVFGSAHLASATDMAINRMLEYQSSTSPYENGLQGLNQDWDRYQLAWRFLGYYIDCNYGDDACQRMVMYAVVSGCKEKQK